MEEIISKLSEKAMEALDNLGSSDDDGYSRKVTDVCKLTGQISEMRKIEDARDAELRRLGENSEKLERETMLKLHEIRQNNWRIIGDIAKTALTGLFGYIDILIIEEFQMHDSFGGDKGLTFIPKFK